MVWFRHGLWLLSRLVGILVRQQLPAGDDRTVLRPAPRKRPRAGRCCRAVGVFRRSDSVFRKRGKSSGAASSGAPREATPRRRNWASRLTSCRWVRSAEPGACPNTRSRPPSRCEAGGRQRHEVGRESSPTGPDESSPTISPVSAPLVRGLASTYPVCRAVCGSRRRQRRPRASARTRRRQGSR